MRLSFVGEMGWELHVPKEHCVRVYRSVMKAGARHGIINAGYRAIDSLSIEKGVWTVLASICSDGLETDFYLAQILGILHCPLSALLSSLPISFAG